MQQKKRLQCSLFFVVRTVGADIIRPRGMHPYLKQFWATSHRAHRRGRRPRRPFVGCLPNPGAMWASRPTWIGAIRRRSAKIVIHLRGRMISAPTFYQRRELSFSIRRSNSSWCSCTFSSASRLTVYWNVNSIMWRLTALISPRIAAMTPCARCTAPRTL